MRPRGKWKDSFRYAWEGIISAVRSERNMKFHLVAAVVVLLAAIYWNVPTGDIALLLIVIGLVLTAELMNTAIESVVNLVAPTWHDLAKKAKDTAAGAVLVTAIVAVIVGCLVFYGPVTSWLRHLM